MTCSKNQIYGYTINELLNEIKRINKEMVYSNIAGFFDGEGWIGTSKNQEHIGLKAQIVNTDFEILYKIKQLFNGRIYTLKKQENHHKDSWMWQIDNRSSLKNFLEKILPYSTVKKQQIELGLKFLELTTDSRGYKKGTSLEEQKIRITISNKLKELKDTKISIKELNIFEKEMKNINIDKNQHTIKDYN